MSLSKEIKCIGACTVLWERNYGACIASSKGGGRGMQVSLTEGLCLWFGAASLFLTIVLLRLPPCAACSRSSYISIQNRRHGQQSLTYLLSWCENEDIQEYTLCCIENLRTWLQVSLTSSFPLASTLSFGADLSFANHFLPYRHKVAKSEQLHVWPICTQSIWCLRVSFSMELLKNKRHNA